MSDDARRYKYPLRVAELAPLAAFRY